MRRITIGETKRIGTRAVTFVLAFSAAAFAASGVSYAKPPPAPQLNAGLCNGLNGVWTAGTCTIPEGSSGVVSPGFKVGDGIRLEIQGKLTIPRGVTVANGGTIVVDNKAGPTGELDERGLPKSDDGWATGLLLLGTLDNSGTITVKNEVTGTEGITVSFSLDQPDPYNPNTWVIDRGTLTNSGTINVQNKDKTRGIKNLGTIANSGSGAILVANTLTSSVGIYNRREGINGILTNAGHITISNSGEGGEFSGYGIYNKGVFTNSANGHFTISPSNVDGDTAGGLWNGGAFTNFGTFTNDRGVYGDGGPSTWGSFNEAGTMINHGTTVVGTPTDPRGTFHNEFIMINLGTITSYGVFDDFTGEAMINYGMFYNYGLINGGTNKGICIDEPGAPGGC